MQQEEVFRQTEELFKDREPMLPQTEGIFKDTQSQGMFKDTQSQRMFKDAQTGSFPNAQVGMAASLGSSDLIRNAMASYDDMMASGSTEQSNPSLEPDIGLTEGIKLEINTEEEQDEEPFEEESDEDLDLGGYDDSDEEEGMEEKVDPQSVAMTSHNTKEEMVKEEEVKMEPEEDEDEFDFASGDGDFLGGGGSVQKKKRKRWIPPEPNGPCEWCGTNFKDVTYLKDHQMRKHPEELALKTGIPIERHQCSFCVKVTFFVIRKGEGGDGWGMCLAFHANFS